MNLPANRIGKIKSRGPGPVRRGIARMAPAAIWVMAIAAAIGLHQRMSPTPAFIGHATDETHTLRHLEPGMVREVLVDLQQAVEPGQIIVRMDDRPERIELAKLQKDLERMHADVTAADARLRTESARAEIEEEDVERQFLLDRERAHLVYLEALRTQAEDTILQRGAAVELEIVNTLYSDEFVSRRELNDTQTDRDALRDRLETHASVVARAKRAFEDADRRWQQFAERPTAGVAYDEELTPLRLAVEVGEREIQDIVGRIDAHVIRSPIRGQVMHILASPGERLAAGTPLVEISATHTDRVVAYLPESSALLVRPGEGVRLHRVAPQNGVQAECEGTIVSLASAIEEAPQRYRVMPNRPTWGRGLVIALKDGAMLMPGEKVKIDLRMSTQ